MDDERYYTRTIVKKQLHSAYLQTERSLRIYLPPGYDERISYPVLFCQDGEQFFNFGRIATHATKLILDEGIEPMLIVGLMLICPDGRRNTPQRELDSSFISDFLWKKCCPKWNDPSLSAPAQTAGCLQEIHSEVPYRCIWPLTIPSCSSRF